MNPPILPSRPRVLVFDSGVGGLSILNEIHRKLPEVELLYACDNQAFPYGTKDETELLERVDTVLKSLFATLCPDIVVVACNTASTVVLPKIRAHFANPVVGVVPAIKPAAALTRSKVIGLLATPATIKRPYTQELIDQFAPDCTVLRLGSSELVTLAEEKLRGITPNRDQLGAILAPLFNHPAMDTLVLACTHFPLLMDEMKALAPRPLQWVDSGEAIARRVHSLLYGDQLLPQGGALPPASFSCWLTEVGTCWEALMAGLKGAGATTIEPIML